MGSDINYPRVLIDNAHDALFVNHLDNAGHYGPFLDVNIALCQRLGYTRNELLNLDPYEIYPTNLKSEINDALAILKNKQRIIFETRFIGKKRQQIPVEISASLFYPHGHQSIISIARDITARKITQRRQENQSAQLRNLATRLQNIREEERALIAREIHDDLGQNLTVLKIQLALLCGQNKKMQERSKPVLALIDQIVERVQKISSKLRPGMLDELGLIPAIEWQSQEFQQHTGIQCDCRLPADDIFLDRDKATAIFRIFQEALTNVARHAQATRVSINFTHEDGILILEVTDNGIGISNAQISNFQSLGLLGMKERATIFGGDLEIRGVPDKGTNLKLIIPLNLDEKSAHVKI